MKMKVKAYIRLFVTLLSAVLFAGACSQVERASAGNEIALSPFGSALTKAGLTPRGTDNMFGVYAYSTNCAGGVDWHNPEAWGNASEYLSNVAFSYKTGGYWGGATAPYYWPFGASLMFAGYCPHQSTPEDGTTVTDVCLVQNKEENNPYLQIAFTQKENPSDMVDLLWFDLADVAGGKTVASTSAPVSIIFQHALSKVSFAFMDSNNYYKLESVTLKGVVNQGTFYSGNTAGWLPELALETLADYNLLPESQNIVLNNWTSDNLYIIPQYLDGIFPTIGETLDSGVDVVLEFTVLGSDFGRQTIEVLLKDYTYRWEIGKSYHYVITANADPIEFGTPAFTITTQTVSM